MSTLLQIASQLAERASKKSDPSFIMQMKDLAVIKRARFIENTLGKHPGKDSIYINSFIADLKLVDPSDECATSPDACDSILRTVEKIPVPIRYGAHPFNFVGSPSGEQSYGWTTFGTEPRLKAIKPTGNKARHTYNNQYIYLFNESNVQKIRVEGVFPDPRMLAKFRTCPDTEGNATSPCWDEEKDFFIEEPIAELIIKDILSNELRIIPRNEKIVIKEDHNV